MGKEVLKKKLESLRLLIRRLESKTPKSGKDFDQDYDLQDVVSVNLERAVQICVDIASHILSETEGKSPSTMAETFLSLAEEKVITKATAKRMVKAVGCRNILVHQYDQIDWNIIYSVLTNHLDDFGSFAKEVVEWNRRN